MTPSLWTAQVLALLGAGLCLVAMSILLVEFDRRPIFSWHGVTLNALISILSTASKGGLLLSVEEATSQWKWILFSRRPRPLMDFDRIDEASRGPLGSLTLIWRLKRGSFVRLGAVIVLLALALDPFAQQLIQLRQELRFVVDLNNNILYRAERYSRGNEFRVQLDHKAIANADFAMQSAILYGLSQPISTVVQQSQYTCPSSNCSWEAFDSLAVCSACNNQASQVERLQDGGGLSFSLQQDNSAARALANMTAFRLPNGLIIDNTNDWNYTSASGFGSVYMTTFGTPNPSDTNSFRDVDSLIWSTSIFKAHPNTSNASAVWPDFPLEATECGIYYCVNSYKSSVQSAILYENTTRRTSAFRNPDSWQLLNPSTWLGNVTEAQKASIAFDNVTSETARSDLQLLVPSSGGNPAAYNLSQNAVDSISAYFQTTFAGTPRTFVNETWIIPGRLNGYYVSTGQIQYDPSINQVIWQTDDLAALFASLAVSMTNAIRSGDDTRARQQGKTGILTTYYEVQWPWITLHATIYVASVAFLAVTMYQGRENAPVWKGSSLATLSFGARVGGIFEGIMDVGQMEREAAAEEVKLLVAYDSIPLDDLQVASTATVNT
ncbi:hypothetical protein Hte_008348 [Hypoxylon texense]